MGGPCLSKAVGRKTVGTRVTVGTIAGTRTTGGYDLAVTDFLTDARINERRKMMQAWADYLDGLRGGGNVVQFRVARGG